MGALAADGRTGHQSSAVHYVFGMLEELSDLFWGRIVTADETPIPHLMLETKRQCMQRVAPREQGPIHAKAASSVGKFQVTVFWNCKGVIHIDYCPPGHSIKGQYYSELLQIVHNKLPEVLCGKIYQ